jgi:hypothetical protein
MVAEAAGIKHASTVLMALVLGATWRATGWKNDAAF